MNNEVIQNLRKFVIQTDKSLAVLSDAISKKHKRLMKLRKRLMPDF